MMLQKIKIVSTKDLYLEKEEEAINNVLLELQQKGYYITNIVYRQNSTIIEYDVFDSSDITTEAESEDCGCEHCDSCSSCCKKNISQKFEEYVNESSVTLEGLNFSYNPFL